MSGPSKNRVERESVNERERELGQSVFGIKEVFRTFSLVYEKSVVSTPGHKTMEVNHIFKAAVTVQQKICSVKLVFEKYKFTIEINASSLQFKRSFPFLPNV